MAYSSTKTAAGSLTTTGTTDIVNTGLPIVTNCTVSFASTPTSASNNCFVLLNTPTAGSITIGTGKIIGPSGAWAAATIFGSVINWQAQ